MGTPEKKPTTVKLALFWAVVQHWGGRVISFLVFFVLARLLAPDDFGLVALATIVITLTEIFIDQGFSDAIVQKEQIDDRYLSTAFWINLGTGLFFTVAAFAISDQISVMMSEPRLATVIHWLSITFVLTGVSSVHTALLRRQMDYKSLALRTTMSNFISGVVSVAMAFLGYGVWALVAQQIVFAAVSTTILWIKSPFRPTLHFDRASVGDLLRFGLSISGIRIVDFLNSRLIDGLIGAKLGSRTLGIYSVGTKLSQILLQMLGASLADVYMSHFSRLQDNLREMADSYLGAIRKVALVSMPLFGFLSLEAQTIVPFIFGKHWTEAAGVFAAFSFMGMVQSVQFFNGSLVNAIGRPGVQLVIGLIKLAVYLMAFFLFVGHGVTAIAWSLSLSSLLVIAPISFGTVLKFTGIKLLSLLKQMALPLALTACSAAASHMVLKYIDLPIAFFHIALSGFVFFGVYAIGVLLFDKGVRQNVLTRVHAVTARA